MNKAGTHSLPFHLTIARKEVFTNSHKMPRTKTTHYLPKCKWP